MCLCCVNACSFLNCFQGVSRGFAYIEYETRDSCLAGLAFNGSTKLKGRELIVVMSTSSASSSAAPGHTGVASPKLYYLSNLPYNVTTAEIYSALESLFQLSQATASSNILAIRILKNRGGAFVEFKQPVPVQVVS